VPRLVLELRLNQYFVKIHTERISQANHPHYNTIRICLWLVPLFRLPCTPIPPSEEHYTVSEEWHQIPQPRCHRYNHPSCTFPDRRSHTLLYSYREDPCISRPHYQRSLAALHRSSLPLHIQHSLPNSYIPLAYTTYPRRCPSLQR